MSESAIGIVVLAAGASSRMGESKQLLRFEGETLLKRAVRTALESGCRPVIVVLGSNADALQKEIEETGALASFNRAWAEGMSSSIRCGLQALDEAALGKHEAVILMLCDQPLVTSGLLRLMVDAYQSSGASVVASEYEAGEGRTLGVPALFSRALFPELMELRGAEGARRIIKRHATKATIIAAPAAAFDVDTPDDYRALRDKESG